MKYVLQDTIVLGFIDGREQVDALLSPGAMLECDGHTIWLLQGDDRIESITTANLIPNLLERGIVIEVAS